MITSSGGWCAPTATLYELTGLDPRRWPAGLTSEDMAWLAEMLHKAELDLTWDFYEIPQISVRRGGIVWPV